MRNRRSWPLPLRAALLLMCPFDLLVSLGMDMYLPAIPDMPRDLATTPSVVQLTLSAYMVVVGLGQLVFGPLSDRFGRRPVLLGGAMLFVLASLALAFTRTAGLFVGLRVLQAAGAAAMLVATFATVRDVYADREEGAVIYGLMGAILAFVPALGPLLGAVLYRQGGIRAIFVALAVAAAIAMIRAHRDWSETRPLDAHAIDFDRIGGVLVHASFWTYTLANAAAMGSFFVYFSIAPSILVEKHGCSSLGFGLAFATVALVMIAVSRFTPRLVAKHGLVGALRIGMITILGGAAILFTSERLVDHVLGFLVPVWIIGVGIAINAAVAARGALAPFPRIAGTATALFYCVSSLVLVGAGTLAVIMLADRAPHRSSPMRRAAPPWSCSSRGPCARLTRPRAGRAEAWGLVPTAPSPRRAVTELL